MAVFFLLTIFPHMTECCPQHRLKKESPSRHLVSDHNVRVFVTRLFLWHQEVTSYQQIEQTLFLDGHLHQPFQKAKKNRANKSDRLCWQEAFHKLISRRVKFRYHGLLGY